MSELICAYMGYTKRRLTLVAVAWVLAAVLFTFVVAPNFSYVDSPQSMVAEAATDASCADGNGDPSFDGPPCQFPAEGGMGGIILGTTTLDGNDLATWLSSEGAGGGSDLFAPTPPGRVESQEQVAYVGLNSLTVDNFFTYKYWGDTTPGGEKFNTYFFFTSDTATLDGTDSCAEGEGGNGTAARGRETCDLLVEVGEFATGGFDASGSVPVLGSISLSASDYWLSEPENDNCGITDTYSLGSGFNSACLGLLESGGKAQDLLSDVTLSLNGLLLRVHRASAIPQPRSGQEPVSKVLQLGEAGNPNSNVYIEIRQGKGIDRAIVPRPANRPIGVPLTLQEQGDRASAFSNDYVCRGNPTGIGETDCTIPNSRLGVTGTAYEDIHR